MKKKKRSSRSSLERQEDRRKVKDIMRLEQDSELAREEVRERR